jgi:hypothetical protein
MNRKRRKVLYPCAFIFFNLNASAPLYRSAFAPFLHPPNPLQRGNYEGTYAFTPLRRNTVTP